MFVKSSRRRSEPVRHPGGPIKEVVLGSSVVGNLTQLAVAAFETESAVIETHTHPTMWELFFVLDGAAVYTVGDDSHLAEPGDLVAVPPGVAHGLCVARAPHRVVYWGLATGPMPKPPAPSQPVRLSTDM